MTRAAWLLSSLLLGLCTTGCIRPPRPLQGQFPPLTVADAQAQPHDGERVRWGGTIVATRPETDRTCLEVVARPLDRRAQPRYDDRTTGRFLACTNGFLDPEVYAPHRDVTVVGTIDRIVTSKVGGRDYPFPQVTVESTYLWPSPEERYASYYGTPYLYGYGPSVYWDPWWGYPFGWYPYGGVYFGGGFHHWGGGGWHGGGWGGGGGWHGGGGGGGHGGGGHH